MYDKSANTQNFRVGINYKMEMVLAKRMIGSVSISKLR
jgi:hypothetical protein